MNAIEILEQHKIRPSMQRIAVMQYLIDHRTHPTVEQIFMGLSPSMPTLSKTTVYNTLKTLSESGAAQTLTIDDRNTCYDADTTPHAHFLCKCCGKVYDLPLNKEKKQIQPHEIDGHDIQEEHYYYKGICKYCKRKKDA